MEQLWFLEFIELLFEFKRKSRRKWRCQAATVPLPAASSQLAHRRPPPSKAGAGAARRFACNSSRHLNLNQPPSFSSPFLCSTVTMLGRPTKFAIADALQSNSSNTQHRLALPLLSESLTLSISAGIGGMPGFRRGHAAMTAVLHLTWPAHLAEALSLITCVLGSLCHREVHLPVVFISTAQGSSERCRDTGFTPSSSSSSTVAASVLPLPQPRSALWSG